MLPGLLLQLDQLMMSQDVKHQEILMRDPVQLRGEVLAKIMQRLMEVRILEDYENLLLYQQMLTRKPARSQMDVRS